MIKIIKFFIAVVMFIAIVFLSVGCLSGFYYVYGNKSVTSTILLDASAQETEFLRNLTGRYISGAQMNTREYLEQTSMPNWMIDYDERQVFLFLI